MFSVLFRVFGFVALFAIAVAGLLWGWAAQHPGQALVLIPGLAITAHLIAKEAREKRRAKFDARMRDEHVPSMSPIEYEQFTARQLERAGWTVKHCGRSGDQGCDVLAELRGFKVVCQAKLYRSRVGNRAVQEAAAARRHYDAQIMAVVAPNGVTKSAHALAATNGVHLLHHSELGALESTARIP
jgi:HJR/Mrr/RecB family endonuclease